MKKRDAEALIVNLQANFGLPEEIRTPKDFIEMSLEDGFFFCGFVLRHGKKKEYHDLNHIHLMLIDWMLTDPNPQKLVLMSRDTLKSTIGRGLFEQKFLKHAYADDEALLGIITGEETLSTEHITLIEHEILTNELIQAFFAGHVPAKPSDAKAWNSDMIRWGRVGVDIGSLRKTLSGRHYLGIWSDNIMNEVNAATPQLREWAVKRWRSQEPLMGESAWEWVFETPWEPDDVSGVILDPEGLFDYRKLHRKSPAMFITETGYSAFSCFVRDENGQLNFPERLDEHYLARKKRKMGSFLYSRMYEGQIVSDEEQVFQRRLIQHFEGRPKFFSRNLVVDCSGTTSAQSTPTAMSDLEWDPDGVGHLVWADDFKVDVLELKRKVCDRVDDAKKEGRPYDQVGVEWEKYGIYLVTELQNERPDIPLVPLRLLGRTRDDRILPLQGLYETGKIKSAKGLDKYEAQLLAYRRGKKGQETGILDTLAHHLDIRLIPKRVEAPDAEAVRLDEFAAQVARDRRFQRFQPTP
ncbi:MAG TPA: hypothetical protein ENO03_06905, partial [Candidatus Aminicenantes bacterium]|nr:hypothetical protein [Candidatus Aminicenantes bacterium]